MAVLLEALKWFHQARKLPPAPYPPKTGGLYNTTNIKANGKRMWRPTSIERIGYVETTWSTEQVITWLGRLCKDTGTPLGSIQIKLRNAAR